MHGSVAPPAHRDPCRTVLGVPQRVRDEVRCDLLEALRLSHHTRRFEIDEEVDSAVAEAWLERVGDRTGDIGQVNRPLDPFRQQQRGIDDAEGVGGDVLRQGHAALHPTGARLWRFKYTMHGKQKRIALGAYPNVGLAEARRKRDEAKLKIHEGTDPLAERKRHKLVGKFKASNCFGDLAEEYIAMVTKEGRSEATIEKTKWLLEKLRPIAGMPIADLQAVDLFAVLKKIEAQGHFETARRCRSFASRVFRYAAASGRADSDPTTLLRGALIAPKPKHHAALVEPEEVGAFLRDSGRHRGLQEYPDMVTLESGVFQICDDIP